jgi:hypothetical protein
MSRQRKKCMHTYNHSMILDAVPVASLTGAGAEVSSFLFRRSFFHCGKPAYLSSVGAAGACALGLMSTQIRGMSGRTASPTRAESTHKIQEWACTDAHVLVAHPHLLLLLLLEQRLLPSRHVAHVCAQHSVSPA